MAGHVELIYGSMYAGKTEELLRRLKRVSIAGRKYQLFKPVIDVRYADVSTHDNASTRKNIQKIVNMYIDDNTDKNALLNNLYKSLGGSIKAEIVNTSSDILSLLQDDTHVVGIDEIQFFDEVIIDVIDKLKEKNIRVIVTGLDMYASNKPFGNIIPALACTAKYVTKLHGVCTDCGAEGYTSYKLDNSDPSKIDVGSTGKYICLCENCAERRDKEKK